MNIYTLEVFIIGGPIDKKFARQNPVMSRTIEIRGDQTLEKLHNAIFKAFNRFDNHLYEFQVGGKVPQDPNARRYSFSSTDDEIMGGKLAGDVRETVMDDLKLKRTKRLVIGLTLATIGGIRSTWLPLSRKHQQAGIPKSPIALGKVRRNTWILRNNTIRVGIP